MQKVQTLIHGKTVIPMSNNLNNSNKLSNPEFDEKLLKDCSIAIQDGRILDILPTHKA